MQVFQPTTTYEFKVPRLTPENKPFEQTFELPCPLLVHMTVRIPDGHKGLAHVWITCPKQMILPAFGSSSRYIEGDGDTIEIYPGIYLDGPPYNFTCHGWSEDSLLSHSFLLRVTSALG